MNQIEQEKSELEAKIKARIQECIDKKYYWRSLEIIDNFGGMSKQDSARYGFLHSKNGFDFKFTETSQYEMDWGDVYTRKLEVMFQSKKILEMTDSDRVLSFIPGEWESEFTVLEQQGVIVGESRRLDAKSAAEYRAARELETAKEKAAEDWGL